MKNKDDEAKRETAAVPVAAPAVTYEEPAAGGSYTRNPETGELVKSQPDQPEQRKE